MSGGVCIFPAVLMRRENESHPTRASDATRMRIAKIAMTTRGLSISWNSDDGESEMSGHLAHTLLKDIIFQLFANCVGVPSFIWLLHR